jgi:hypothetical protein
MPSRLVRVLLITSCLFTIAGSADKNDWLIIPGARAGPITGKTTRAELDRIFGAKNVEDGDITISDAGPEPGTTVFQDKPEEMVTIVWNQNKPAAHISTLVFCQESVPPNGCRWHTRDGIGIGTTLKELEKMNGRKFKLSGLGWDYGGTVLSWEGGVLERLKPACGGLSIRLEEPSGSDSHERAHLVEQVGGDTDFWSSDNAMQALNPAVGWMGFSFEGCAR